MSAGSYDFEVIRGNTQTLVFTFKDGVAPFDLTGSEVIFRATLRGAEILRKTTDDAGLSMEDPADGEVTLALSAEESRLIALGAVTKYEVERRIAGSQRTLLAGKITGTNGVNDD